MFPLPDSHSASSKSQTKSQGEGTTMTTHNNTPKDQYHRAPLNDLIIGAITGAVWGLVFLVHYMTSEEPKDTRAYVSIFVMSFIFPLVGWFTGLQGRKISKHDNIKRRRHRIKILGATMSTLTGILMLFVASLFANDRIFSIKETIFHLFLLAIFPLAGLVLSTFCIEIKDSRFPFIPSMSTVTIIVLFISVAIWWFFYMIIGTIFFFGS